MDNNVKELIKEASFDGKAIGLTSKMWIMKTGKVFSTNGQWHYLWALQNKKMLEEQFFIDFSDLTTKSDEQTVRLHLIKQGMFRLNHEARGNRVTIEGLSKYFNKRVKDSILGLVMDNADDFSYLNITLFDESVERVVKTRSASFFNMDERQKTDKTQELLIENNKYKTEEELIWESYLNQYQINYITPNSFNEALKLNGFSVSKENDKFSEYFGIIGEAVDFEFSDKGGIIVFSVEVNAIGMSKNRLVNWFQQKYQTIKNIISKDKKIDKVILAYDEIYGVTIGNFTKGRYKAKNGTTYDEKSLSVEIIGISEETLNKVAANLARDFNQETVLVKNYQTNKIYLVNQK